ncbi:unnamed protein product, partial [marine sediment metagenome]
MGLFAALSSKPVKEFSFNQLPQKAFGIMLACVVLIAGSVVGVYTMGQKYTGALNY